MTKIRINNAAHTFVLACSRGPMRSMGTRINENVWEIEVDDETLAALQKRAEATGLSFSDVLLSMRGRLN